MPEGGCFLDESLAGGLDSQYGSFAYYHKGLSCQQLEKYEEAAQAFENACQADPYFTNIDYCLLAQGRCYEKLMKSGAASEAEAKSVITRIYSELVSKCPQSPYAVIAKSWLKKNS